MLALLCVVVLGGQARANPKQEAREYARRGGVAYNLGNYEEAAQYYEQAYRLVQDPNLLFNIAQAYRLAGNSDKAIGAYKGFLRTATAEHQNRKVAEQHLRELEAPPAAPPPRKADEPVSNSEAKPADNDPFNPYADDSGKPPPDRATSPSAADSFIQRFSPTVGGLLGLANQRGFDEGYRARFQLYARAEHNGHRYELGYFRLPLFAPNPHYTTSALYFRFRARDRWYAQAGLLGQNGDFHAAGGMEWDYLSIGAQVQRVGDRALCNSASSEEAATYVVPELQVTLPVVTGLRALAYGSLRHALLSSEGCTFHPSMSTLIVEGEWDVAEHISVRGGFAFYKFFGQAVASAGSWPSMDPAGAFHLAGRYKLDQTFTLFGSYRRIQYAGGVNELIFGMDVGLSRL